MIINEEHIAVLAQHMELLQVSYHELMELLGKHTTTDYELRKAVCAITEVGVEFDCLLRNGDLHKLYVTWEDMTTQYYSSSLITLRDMLGISTQLHKD